jgi:hypothetical protein
LNLINRHRMDFIGHGHASPKHCTVEKLLNAPRDAGVCERLQSVADLPPLLARALQLGQPTTGCGGGGPWMHCYTHIGTAEWYNSD